MFCRDFGSTSRWQLVGRENGSRPEVLSWRCTGCGSGRYQYADCTNVRTPCVVVLDENLRRTVANIDYGDALARLELEAWRLYLGSRPIQDPARPPVNFEGYC